MAVSRILLIGFIGFLLRSDVLLADSRFYLSKLSLTAENAEVLVVHKHDVQEVKDLNEEPEVRGFVLDLNSTLQIRRKSDGKEIFSQDVMPLTNLVNVDSGRYFAGLSTLKTLSYEYNFILFTQAGQVITTALVTRFSGHCDSLSASVTNFIRWFDEEEPGVELIFDNEKITRVIVKNPYDRTASEGLGKCVIEVSSAT